MATSDSTGSTPAFTLHTMYRSSATARLRIALNLKNIPYTPIYVDLNGGQQRTPEYLKLNPSGTVPLLVHHSLTPGKDLASIGQSQAALEYIEEITASLPNNFPLLPPASDPAGRAFVRELVTLCVADIQGVTSMRTRNAVEKLGADKDAWAAEWTRRGLKAYEGTLAKWHGEEVGDFSYGGAPTIADCTLVPAVWNAAQVGIDVAEYPRLKRIFDAMEELEAVHKASYPQQADWPGELKAF